MHFSPVTEMQVVWILAVRMASSSIACCIFHNISIPFYYSDTVLRVAEAMIGAKVKIFVFRHVQLCFSNLAPDIVPRIFGLFSILFSSRRSGRNFSYEPRAKFIRAHVKRPLRSEIGSNGRRWIDLFFIESNFFWSRIWIKCRGDDFNTSMIMYDQSIIWGTSFHIIKLHRTDSFLILWHSFCLRSRGG